MIKEDWLNNSFLQLHFPPPFLVKKEIAHDGQEGFTSCACIYVPVQCA